MQGKKRFIVYVLFALLTSILNIGVYLIVYNFIIKSILVANVCAYAVSITVSFMINRKIVFSSNKEKIVKKFIAYLLMKLFALLVDSCVLFVLDDCLHINNTIAKIIANCSTTFSNYFISKLIFSDKGS